MLTYVVWACYVYAAVWAVASILFYAVNRWCAEPTDPRPSVWGAIGLGLAWPVVLALLLRFVWTAVRAERVWRPGR